MSVQAGHSATLSVSCDGTAPFTYQWSKNAATIDGATAASYLITNAAPSDAGTYTVIVSNLAGSTTSDKATLTIAPMTATLTASIVSVNFPQPSIVQWRLNGQTISGANQMTYSFDPIAAPGSYSFTATWPNPVPLK